MSDSARDAKRLTGSRGYALCWVLLLVFAMSALLGLTAAHVAYFSGLADVSSRRAQARSDLFSLTNLALRWLKSELKTGTNWRADAIRLDEDLTDSEDLCIFSHETPEGSVKVFDLGYDPQNLKDPPDDILSFPPSYPGAYLVRAAVAKGGLAPMTAESVFVLIAVGVPGGGLADNPLFSREMFR
jgi:hypothetical protein